MAENLMFRKKKIGPLLGHSVLLAALLVQTTICNRDWCAPSETLKNTSRVTHTAEFSCHGHKNSMDQAQRPASEDDSQCQSIELLQAELGLTLILPMLVSLPAWNQSGIAFEPFFNGTPYPLTLADIPPPAAELWLQKQSFII